MTTKRMLVRGGQVYDHDGDVHKPPVADILIEDRKIVAVGPDLAADSTTEIIDASGRLVVPGLINAHYHSHDTLCRGMFEELPLEMWLLYTLPMGQNRSKEEVRARTLVGALESLRCGITTVQDMLGLNPLTDDYTDVVISAYREIGIRVVFSPMVWDIPAIGMVRHKDVLPTDVQEMLGTKALPARYLSASRMEMRNNDDQRRSEICGTAGRSRSATACNSSSEGPGRSDRMPCASSASAGSPGASIDTR